MVKMELAAKRERTHQNRLPRDDGVVRRSESDPVTVTEQRAKSRERKVWISQSQRWRHEMFIRAHKGADWAARREEFISIELLRPSSGVYSGRYQDKD